MLGDRAAEVDGSQRGEDERLQRGDQADLEEEEDDPQGQRHPAEGLEVLGIFTLPFGIALFLFEVGLVATLQAFIFATLSAIYLGGAVAEHH